MAGTTFPARAILALLALLLGGGALAAPAAGIPPGDRVIPREEITDTRCLECHGQKGFGTRSATDGRWRTLDLDADAFHQSVHGRYGCLECHTDIEQLPHRVSLRPVDCVGCHLAQGEGAAPPRPAWLDGEGRRLDLVIRTRRYTHSVHARRQGARNNATCADCHTGHYVFPSSDPRSTVHRLNSPGTCSRCHPRELEAYRRSIHGASLKRPWKGESATCVDCHSAHRIREVEALSAHRVMVEECGTCHEREVRSYKATTHGQLAWLGDREVAQCKDCHAPHDTHRVDDPLSLVSAENRLDTCHKCHEDAGPEFVKFRAHADVGDFERNPELWWLGTVMLGIIVLTLVFFYSHSMLWFWRELKSRPWEWVTVDGRRFRVRAKRVKHHSGRAFRRFPWYWRLNHWALALSVLTLVLTGMVVMFPDTGWATAIIDFLGGPRAFGYIHRTAAVVFLLAVFGHGAAVLWRVSRDREFDWFGPDSLLPRKKDWEDMKAQFRWFFGKGEPPKFDRWTYWEKFDYWAVYWGAFVIGVSGIILWFSPFFSRFLPGWAFNLATLAHGLEAFLAVMTLFVVHFFNNHFRPSKFPLDRVMFTGRWDLEEFKEERPEHYRRLKESGELEKYLEEPPSKGFETVSYALGFALLGFGLFLLVLVVIGFFHRGLV